MKLDKNRRTSNIKSMNTQYKHIVIPEAGFMQKYMTIVFFTMFRIHFIVTSEAAFIQNDMKIIFVTMFRIHFIVTSEAGFMQKSYTN